MSKLPIANKELGQHFLQDTKVISNITKDFSEECDVIVEVGPGPAILTEHLAKHNKDYYIIEKDLRFKEYIYQFVPQEKCYFQDALEFNWQEFIEENDLRNKKIWLVSNLPYNVGTVLFTGFLQIKEIKFMSLMFQKEVGDKTYFRQVKNQMNGLLFLSQNYFESKKLMLVSPGCFTPPPKVDSIVVSYTRKESPEISIESFNKLNKFTRLLFSMKRKQLRSVLKSQYSKEILDALFEQTKVSPTLRAEALSTDEIYKLFKHLNKN